MRSCSIALSDLPRKTAETRLVATDDPSLCDLFRDNRYAATCKTQLSGFASVVINVTGIEFNCYLTRPSLELPNFPFRNTRRELSESAQWNRRNLVDSVAVGTILLYLCNVVLRRIFVY